MGMILAGRRGAKTGGYVLDLSPDVVEQLQRAIRIRHGDTDRRSAGGSPGSGRVESDLTPREIQSRLRSGRSLAEVAAEAGVGIDWVERFSAPILAEREAVIKRAGRMFVTTARGDMSERSLAESVQRNLAIRGVNLADDELDECWSAGYLQDRDWLVCLRVRVKGRDVEAQWLLTHADGTLVARDAVASELGFIGSARQAGLHQSQEEGAAARATPTGGAPRRSRRAGPASGGPAAVTHDGPAGADREPGSTPAVHTGTPPGPAATREAASPEGVPSEAGQHMPGQPTSGQPEAVQSVVQAEAVQSEAVQSEAVQAEAVQAEGERAPGQPEAQRAATGGTGTAAGRGLHDAGAGPGRLFDPHGDDPSGGALPDPG
jgi:hypothetical protein